MKCHMIIYLHIRVYIYTCICINMYMYIYLHIYRKYHRCNQRISIFYQVHRKAIDGWKSIRKEAIEQELCDVV
jgi:hypothetical protein